MRQTMVGAVPPPPCPSSLYKPVVIGPASWPECCENIVMFGVAAGLPLSSQVNLYATQTGTGTALYASCDSIQHCTGKVEV